MAGRAREVPPGYIKTADAATLLGVSRSTIDRHRDRYAPIFVDRTWCLSEKLVQREADRKTVRSEPLTDYRQRVLLAVLNRTSEQISMAQHHVSSAQDHVTRSQSHLAHLHAQLDSAG